MIHPIFLVLDVPVEHRAVRFQSEFMRDARSLDPLIAIDLVIANHAADALVEDFGAAAGKRIHSGGLQSLQRFADAQLRALREEGDFDHRECFQMNLWEALFESRNEIEEVLERQIRMQSAHDVKLRYGFGIS